MNRPELCCCDDVRVSDCFRVVPVAATSARDTSVQSSSCISLPAGGSRHSTLPLGSYHHQPLTQAVLDRLDLVLVLDVVLDRLDSD